MWLIPYSIVPTSSSRDSPSTHGSYIISHSGKFIILARLDLTLVPVKFAETESAGSEKEI